MVRKFQKRLDRDAPQHAFLSTKPLPVPFVAAPSKRDQQVQISEPCIHSNSKSTNFKQNEHSVPKEKFHVTNPTSAVVTPSKRYQQAHISEPYIQSTSKSTTSKKNEQSIPTVENENMSGKFHSGTTASKPITYTFLSTKPFPFVASPSKSDQQVQISEPCIHSNSKSTNFKQNEHSVPKEKFHVTNPISAVVTPSKRYQQAHISEPYIQSTSKSTTSKKNEQSIPTVENENMSGKFHSGTTASKPITYTFLSTKPFPFVATPSKSDQQVQINEPYIQSTSKSKNFKQNEHSIQTMKKEYLYGDFHVDALALKSLKHTVHVTKSTNNVDHYIQSTSNSTHFKQNMQSVLTYGHNAPGILIKESIHYSPTSSGLTPRVGG